MKLIYKLPASPAVSALLARTGYDAVEKSIGNLMLRCGTPCQQGSS